MALLALAVPLTIAWVHERQERCADGVVKRGEYHECVGVTDGSYHFNADLKDVIGKIEEENKKVTSKGGYVSIAYMTSLTPRQDEDSNTKDSIRHELEGAYLAQTRVNDGDLSVSPKVKLLLANTGSQSEQWEHTVGELIKRKNTKDKVVAVIGLGPSTDSNIQAMAKLSAAGIATVAGTMTTDDLDERVHGEIVAIGPEASKGAAAFARVAPTNTEEAIAAGNYLKQQAKKEPKGGKKKVILVQDVNKDNHYATTLGSAFTSEFPTQRGLEILDDPKQYNSAQKDVWQAQMVGMIPEICAADPDFIYFAGRGIHLKKFLAALGNRNTHTCPGQLTVITGDDTTNVKDNELKAATESRVEILYTGLAHRQMLGRLGLANNNDLEFRRLDELFPDDQLTDGQDIMAHDALLAAAFAANQARTSGDHVTGETVGGMFTFLEEKDIPGGSGWISFHNNGNSRDKALPILSLNAEGRSELVAIACPSGDVLDVHGPGKCPVPR